MEPGRPPGSANEMRDQAHPAQPGGPSRVHRERARTHWSETRRGRKAGAYHGANDRDAWPPRLGAWLPRHWGPGVTLPPAEMRLQRRLRGPLHERTRWAPTFALLAMHPVRTGATI